MNEQQQMIRETLQRLLTDLCTPVVVDAAEKGEWPAELWNTLAETGLTLAGISEENGGSGGDIADSLLVLQEAAKFGAPLPLAEHFIAALLLSRAGQSAGQGPMTIAVGRFELDGDNRLTGEADAVAFARWCDEIVLVASSSEGKRLCRVPVSSFGITQGSSVAGEPRDRLVVDLVLDASTISLAQDDIEDSILLMGAATRAVMMAGALDSILEMSVQYAMERSQFGRPISKFQAIQHQLAALAGEVAASSMASYGAVSSFDDLDAVEIAVAKARVGEAVSVATDIAHGVHGAMGYTMEHSLNHRTRRLWCWRDEFGTERYWQKAAGSHFLESGADGLWNAITSRG
jgi:acyl-CoA dehydrogenase